MIDDGEDKIEAKILWNEELCESKNHKLYSQDITYYKKIQYGV